MAEFEQSIDYVLANEGGFVDNPADPGGATNFGITLQTLKDYRGKPTSVEDVKHLTLAEAKEIYRKNYWAPIHGDKIESQVIATLIFDCAVNMGVGVAVGLSTSIDHKSDPQFIYDFSWAVANRYCKICISNPKRLVFLVGWMRRAHRMMHFLVPPVLSKIEPTSSLSDSAHS